MLHRSSISAAGSIALSLLVAGWSRPDDLETGLLQKFQQQSQKAALQAKQDVEKNLARALELSPTDPERALELLRQSKELLFAADRLPRQERDALMKKLDDGFRDARARLESQQEAARRAAALVKPVPSTTAPSEPDAKYERKLAVSPIVFRPNIVAVPSAAQAQVTPVVSADRRWVRINLSGSFFMFR